MKHLNNDILCSVGIKTTGPLPYHDNLIQVAVIPLTVAIRPRQDILPYDMNILAGRPENVDKEKMHRKYNKYVEIQQNAQEPYFAADLFERWFDRLGLRFNKRIQMIGYNTPKIVGFLQDWLGPQSYERFFDYRTRDIVTCATFVNDYAEFSGQPYIVQKTDLSYLASTFHIETNARTRDAMEEADISAKIYKNLMQKHTTTFEQHQRKAMAKVLKDVADGTVLTVEQREQISKLLETEKVMTGGEANEDEV